MVEDEKRRRAPAMTLEQRREAIVASTVPLLVEHGGAVTTSQIAAAAGIAEGTVFRAFKDKQELLVACMRAGLNSDEEVAHIEGIERALPLADRLTEAVRAISGYLDRIWQVGQALQAAGISREAMHDRMHGDEGRAKSPENGPPREMLRVNDAMSGLFGPDDLRLPPAHSARLLLGLVLTNRMGTNFGTSVSEPAELVDLFLHGAIRTDHRGEPS
ncbi:MAG: TetR family transcriptional regulator [Actinophytocola sp.]|uniref:TetR/AcrR family transcriptional regulator n=1 Tax=Actinophytocola sp. TaxID=1872138 RepID=UPI0013299221|nr:TetR family transcriptional regulator [Actinophytocola sp.]MPZ84420.1 TetR family transcriptional regulator [Actinophytocola sp.]